MTDEIPETRIDSDTAQKLPAPTMDVEIRETPLGGNLKDFIELVDYVYQNDPNHVRPLDMDTKDRLSPKHPFWDHAEGAVFTAHRNGWCIGRCTAQIDRLHLDRYQDDTGFFGYVDTIDDEDVCTSLLNAAASWLAARGMKRMRGPFMMSTNDMVGCLVEGFDTPPSIQMPHHRPYQGGLIEKAGLSKLKDAFAWHYTVGDIPKRAQKGYDEIAAMPDIKARHADPKQFERDVRIIMNVYNDAWQDNWGFIPLTEAELTQLAKELKLILVPELTYIVELKGEPVGVALGMPNLNEVIGDLHGKLFPVGILKLLWRMKFARPKSGRLIILGVSRKLRQQRKFAGMSAYLYVAMNQAAARVGITHGELSWTLEDNHPVNVGIKLMGGEIYKRYRLYEKELSR